MMSMPKQKHLINISFSVDAPIATEIEIRAEKLNISIAKFVRDIVLSAISDPEHKELNNK